MKYPPNYQTTSTKEKLSNGPADMPDRGGHKPFYQTTSLQVPLSRKENPVANFGNKPGMGEVQHSGTSVKLAREASIPYDRLNATKPQIGGGPGAGGKKKK